ncbi:Enzymatic polyprotein endonuclease reverse, partial [Temnothorax longispinosus]
MMPLDAEKPGILREAHASAIGGHKGVTKTYRRLREKYHWQGMKNDVQEFVRNCRNCQLKKLVRVKTRQPMVLTDTPGAAFDKISMDIMGPLPITNTGYSYICLLYTCTRGYLDDHATTEIDALTARSFCEGLPLTYRIQLNRRDHYNLSAAFAHVKTLAKRQELDNTRFNNPRKDD